jgi:GxxExxY protein
MEIEFIEHTIPYYREKKFAVNYKGRTLRNPYSADFVVYDSIILEVKSVVSIVPAHVYQAISYLAVSQQKLGMVINYGEKSLVWKRIVF